jgi:hypothetical protein
MDDPHGAQVLMRCWSDGEAAIVGQLLVSYGIPCQAVSDISHGVLPIAIDGLGEVRILVPARQVREAGALLAEHRRHGLCVIAGGKSSTRER